MCDKPVKIWRVTNLKNAEVKVLHRQPQETPKTLVQELNRKCGYCILCRLEISREWTIRQECEAQMHTHNSFITLTYRNECLPIGGSVQMSDLSSFMKRLRKRVYDDWKLRARTIPKAKAKLQFSQGIKKERAARRLDSLLTQAERKPYLYDYNTNEAPRISFYGVGEYGEQGGRPHYHICVFGLSYSDMSRGAGEQHETMSYYNEELESTWKAGIAVVSHFSAKTASYVARYVTKKVIKHGVYGGREDEATINEYGELMPIEPERTLMSKRPAIGIRWLNKYKCDIVDGTLTSTTGLMMNVPRTFMRYLKKNDEEFFTKIALHQEEKFLEKFEKLKKDGHINPEKELLERNRARAVAVTKRLKGQFENENL